MLTTVDNQLCESRLDEYTQSGTWTKFAHIGSVVAVRFVRETEIVSRHDLPSSVLGATEPVSFRDGIAYFGDWLKHPGATSVLVSCKVYPEKSCA